MMTTICKQSNNQQEEKTYELYMILLVHGLFLDKNNNLGGALSNTVQEIIAIPEWHVIPYPIGKAVKIELYDRNGSTSHSKHRQHIFKYTKCKNQKANHLHLVASGPPINEYI